MPNKQKKTVIVGLGNNKSILQKALEGETISYVDTPKYLSCIPLSETSIGQNSISEIEIEMIPIGTKIKTFNGELAKRNYLIGNVILDHLENCPLYKMASRYIDEDNDSFNVYYYNNISDKFFTTEKISKKWKIKGELKFVLFGKDDDFESAVNILKDDEFLSLHTLVYKNIDIANNKPIAYNIIEIRIDEDLNVYYRLNDKTDSFYSNSNLSLLLEYLQEVSVTDEEELEGMRNNNLLCRAVKIVKIEI